MDFNQWLQDFLQRSLDFLPHLIFGLIIFALSLYLSVPAARWSHHRFCPAGHHAQFHRRAHPDDP